MKYCVIKTSGSQYKICEGDFLNISGFVGEKGKEIVFEEVLLVCEDGKIKLGNPTVKDSLVKGEVVEHKLGEKLIISKFKAKTGYRRKKGFRPKESKILIKKIQ